MKQNRIFLNQENFQLKYGYLKKSFNGLFEF